MRIAIPTDDSRTVEDHFGRAEYFMIVEIENGKEISRSLSENLHAKGHGHHGHHEHHNHHEHKHANGHHNGNCDNNECENGHEHGHGYSHGHTHGHDEVFASTGDIEAVIAVRIGPHMFEDLKEKNIDVYLVTPNTPIDEAVSKMILGELKKIEPRR
ncbi:NifB/NifX family molybdenum-iron cluster-binding protein [Fervidobacterium sp.]